MTDSPKGALRSLALAESWPVACKVSQLPFPPAEFLLLFRIAAQPIKRQN